MKIMRPLALTVAFIAGTTLTSVSQANELTGSVKAACESQLCLYGQLMGQPFNKECKKPVNDFFKIHVTRKGKFSPSRTANARKDFLDSCPTGNISETGMIMNKYGRKRGL